MAINRVDQKGIASCTVATQDIADETLTNAFFGPSTIANSQLANSVFTINGDQVSLGGSLTIKEEVDWQALTVADGSTQLTAVAGRGYFLDTNAGVIEVILPSSPSRGDKIVLVDYSGTFATNNCIINTKLQKIDSTLNEGLFKLTTNNTIAYLVYVDTNKGWLVYLNQAAGTTPSAILTGNYDSPFITATGGTVTETGNFKVHTFTGDGTFVVSSSIPTSKVDYIVVAGGGAGAYDGGAGGGGAGGFREGRASAPAYTASPVVAPDGLPVSNQTYPVTVGGGGSAGICAVGKGSNSVFSTITSTGGGGGGTRGPLDRGGQAGGSGGGGGGSPGSANNDPGPGNNPPVSPPQGNNGGEGDSGPPFHAGAGGGGATAAGQNSQPNGTGGRGGAGATTCITGSPVAYAGGGGAGGPSGGSPGAGGTAGLGSPCSTGGRGQSSPARGGCAAVTGTTNRGGGGGGGYYFSGEGKAGGKGIVIIRYKFQ